MRRRSHHGPHPARRPRLPRRRVLGSRESFTVSHLDDDLKREPLSLSLARRIRIFSSRRAARSGDVGGALGAVDAASLSARTRGVSKKGRLSYAVGGFVVDGSLSLSLSRDRCARARAWRSASRSSTWSSTRASPPCTRLAPRPKVERDAVIRIPHAQSFKMSQDRDALGSRFFSQNARHDI